MANHSELRDLRSEDIHFKNKYKFMILKITMMPHIQEAFVWSIVNTKCILQYPFGVLFWCLIYRQNIFKKLASFIYAYFINFRFNVCVLAALLIGICQPDISKIFFRVMSENNCSHKNVLLIIKLIDVEGWSHAWPQSWPIEILGSLLNIIVWSVFLKIFPETE